MTTAAEPTTGTESAVVAADREPVAKRLARVLFAFGLFAFALLQALPGAIATARPQSVAVVWIGTALWLVSLAGFLIGSYGLLGFRMFSRVWKGATIVAALASLALLLGWRQWWAWPAMILDCAIISVSVDSKPLKWTQGKRGPIRWIVGAIVRLAALALLVYACGVVAMRPTYQQWGATDEEIGRRMLGDEQIDNRVFVANHVVTVNAPPERVWPWIAQLGQGKSGFYTHPYLDRLLGAEPPASYELRPEWQAVKVDDYVRASTPGWLGGGIKDSAGWRIAAVEPNRRLLLDRWGLFWLEPASANQTRLGIRTDLVDIRWWAAPGVVFGLEPLGYALEQRLLTKVKELSEKSGTQSGRP